MKKNEIYELNKSFRELFSTKETFFTYENYYSTLVAWIKSKEELKGEIEKDDRLAVLLSFNPNNNIIETPDILLEMEKERLSSIEYESIENLLMGIRDTLWDLVTIYSDKDCPVCDDGLRYVMVENDKTEGKELTLECDTCGWLEHLDGREWTGGIVKMYPVNSEEIKNYLAKK
jgi:hypothetical protein